MVLNSITYVIITIFSYLIGSIPWGYIIAKSRGVDIRLEGSGNIGATNVMRTLGKKYGITCFLLDFLKGFLPILIVLIFKKYIILSDFIVVLAAFATILGHMYPIYLKFKGGKGVSTMAGILLAIAPLSFLSGAIVWVIIFHISRYVSLASILGAISLPLSAFLLDKFTRVELPFILQIMLVIMALLVIIRHFSNIKRLLDGSENKFIKKSKKVLPAGNGNGK